MKGKLEGKVAVAMGAAMGNGEGIAQIMARHGAHAVLWDISETVSDTAESIKSKDGNATGVKLDVTDFKACQEAADKTIADQCKIDILCNNAGVIRLANFLDISDEVRDFHFDVNIKGVWHSTKAVLPNMVKNKYGRIVVMSSVTGPMVADEGETAYATTKAALWGSTKALAREVAKDEINVNAICPGYILTPMAEQIAKESEPKNPDSVIEGIAKGVPGGQT